MSNTYTQVFGGSAIYPSDVSYLSIELDSNIVLEWPLEATGGNNVVARIIDVSTDGIFTITMPDATNVGVGQTVLFNNLGPDIVTVNNLAGNAILSMSPGEQWQIYLTDNTTAGGQWRVFRYGAATAQAQASALAGPGLTALGSELAQNIAVVPFSVSPLALTSADRAKAFVWTGALGTVSLPNIATAAAGWSVQIRNNGSGDLTIDPAGSETINSALTLTLRPGDSAMVVTDGVEWFTIGLGQQAIFAFDYTVIDLSDVGGAYTLSGSELNRIAYRFTTSTSPLASSVTVFVPATVQQYWVNNETMGPYTLELAAVGGGPAVTVPQGESNIYYCDGTDIVQATTTASFGGTLGIGQGGTGSSTKEGALFNLGGSGIGTAVFTALTTSAARTAISAAGAGANSDITSLSGLTTPLSVAQGGTGANNAGGARTSLGAAAAGSNSDITALTAAPGILVGAPTGGAQGSGTLNATGLFINGVAVGTGSGSVTSVNASGGTTGLTFTGSPSLPITTSGTLTLGGTLDVDNGGTGQTSYTDGQLLIGNTTGNTLTKNTLAAGSGISITNGPGTITIAATGSGGTVTSVNASGGTTGLTFTGSPSALPITTSGTLTLGGTLAVPNGGTGAATASGARLNLGAAASGPALSSGLTMSTGRILGRTTAGAGALEELSVSTGLALTGGALSLSGVITSTGLLMNSARMLGRSSAGTGFIEDISIGSGLTLSAGVLSATSGGGGTVTSVALSGGTTGLTVSGSPITTFGTITLGGTLAVANGGTGATTLTGVVIGNGTSAFTVKTNPAGAFVGTTDTQTLTNKTLEASNSVNDTGAIAATSVGFRGIPQNSRGSAYTLALTDAGKHISISTGGVTIPANSSVAFPVGTTIVIYNNSSSAQNISITTDTLRLAGTATTGTRSLAQRGVATCIKVASTEWVVTGNVT
jgi:hypothetical protein